MPRADLIVVALILALLPAAPPDKRLGYDFIKIYTNLSREITDVFLNQTRMWFSPRRRLASVRSIVQPGSG